MKNVIIIISLLIYSKVNLAQKASNVLENGIQVRTGQKIFLSYENKTLSYDVAKSLQDISQPIDYTTLYDSSIFLVSKNSINIYIAPLNPLNYSLNSNNEITVDEITSQATNYNLSLIDILTKTIPQGDIPKLNEVASKLNKNKKSNNSATQECDHILLRDKLVSFQEKLKDSKKDKIIAIFNDLKALDFGEEKITINKLNEIKQRIEDISSFFRIEDSLLTDIRDKIKTVNCPHTDPYILEHIFNAAFKDLYNIHEEQKKRLTNLVKVYSIVKKTADTASIGGRVDGLRWCYKIGSISVEQGKISNVTIIINESGYILSDNEEIISTQTKELTKKTIRIRKFQRFVPEVSAGTVFTFFKYNVYGTTSDSSGQQYVDAPTQNTVKNINISAMINWTVFCNNSSIMPLIQTGLGVNGGIPTILLGGGLRFSNNAKNRIRFTGGVAATWVNDLDKLKVGSKVTGTSDIEKDLKYKIEPVFSPYLGIQYNF